MKRKMRTKNVLVFLIIVSMLSMGVVATWTYMLSGSITGNVVSLEPNQVLYFSESVGDIGIINASYEAVSVNKTIDIINDNGIIPLTFNASETRIDLDDGCLDYENDVVVNYYLDGSQIFNNDNVSFNSGIQEFTIEMNALKGSCPQNVTADVLFS